MEPYDNSTLSLPKEEDEDVSWWEVCIFLVMSVPTAVVNAFVIFLIMHKKALKTATNLILASLALSDFFMGALGIPLILVCSALENSGICIASAIFVKLISFTTVAHIFLLTCDRYIYIMCALRYEDLIHRRRAWKVLLITWMTTTLACTVRLTWLLGNDEDEEFQEDHRENIYHIFSFAFFFCLLFVVITIMDVHMMCIVHRQTKLIYQRNLPSHLRKQSARQLIGRKRKAVLTCIIILIMYVFCWLPYFVLALMKKPINLAIWLQWLIYHVRFLSSACNPWLYTLRKHDLKKEAISWLRQTFPCLSLKRREEENTSIALHTTGTEERVNNPHEPDIQDSAMPLTNSPEATVQI